MTEKYNYGNINVCVRTEDKPQCNSSCTRNTLLRNNRIYLFRFSDHSKLYDFAYGTTKLSVS